MVQTTNATCEATQHALGNVERNAKLEAALKYAAEGFRILPCHSMRNGKCSCRQKMCPKPGKHPRIGRWPSLATCDPAQIAKWWKQWPDANLGVATGAGSGIVALDYDGDEGQQTLQALSTDDPAILDTRSHQTGSGGTHLLFRHPGVHVGNSARTLKPGMDVRGEAGLIILPPSNHESGNDYAVVNAGPIADMPESVRVLFTACHKERLRKTKSDQERPSKTMQGRKERESVDAEKLPSVPKERIEWAINASLPISQGRRNQQVFAFARHLRAIDGITADVPATCFRQIVEQWYRLALEQATRLEFSIVGDIEETWTDFRFAWARVQHPVGASLSPVFDHVSLMDEQGEIEKPVWNALAFFRRTDDDAMRLLVGVIFELAEQAGDKPFELARNAGAIHFKRLRFNHVDSKWMLRRLKTLADDGIVLCVDRGRSGAKGIGKTAQYHWIWTMKDPPEVQF